MCIHTWFNAANRLLCNRIEWNLLKIRWGDKLNEVTDHIKCVVNTRFDSQVCVIRKTIRKYEMELNKFAFNVPAIKPHTVIIIHCLWLFHCKRWIAGVKLRRAYFRKCIFKVWINFIRINLHIKALFHEIYDFRKWFTLLALVSGLKVAMSFCSSHCSSCLSAKNKSCPDFSAKLCKWFHLWLPIKLRNSFDNECVQSMGEKKCLGFVDFSRFLPTN